MNYSPLLSIVIPIYNAARFLPRCLESLLGQTYKNLEIICVDDGSSDDSLAVLKEYAAKDARIKVIHQENAGVSAARNRGLDAATGDYLAFVDADDWVENNTYEKVISLFTPEIDIACMGAEIDGELPNKQEIEEYLANIPMAPAPIQSELFSRGNLTLWNKVYRKSLIDDYQLRFLETIAYGEDIAFVCCMLAVSRCVTGVADRLYHYVQHAHSAMKDTRRPLRIGKDLLCAWSQVLSFYENTGTLKKNRPLLARMFIEYYNSSKELGSTLATPKKAWKLVLKSGLHQTKHSKELEWFRNEKTPAWIRLFHWVVNSRVCYGIAGRAIFSVAYGTNDIIYRLMGRVIYTKLRKDSI